jgi:hypothetical protein
LSGHGKFPVSNQYIFIISFPSLFFMREERKGLAALIIGVVLILAFIIAPVAADTMIREDATNRLGEDYTSLGLGTAGYDGTAESCSQNCLNQPSCNAATFVASDQTCWLKEIVPPATAESGLTSFVRQKETPTVTVSAGSGGIKAPGFECLFAILGCIVVLMVRKSMQ